MTRVPEPGPAARPYGPYETEREAAHAARSLVCGQTRVANSFLWPT